MGNANSSGSSVNTPKVEKINESLYELYSPPESEKPLVDVVFFHGLQQTDYRDAYWKTWSSDGETIWPQTFLSKDLPRCRVLSVSYDSCIHQSKCGGRLDMYNIGENLMYSILGDKDADVGGVRSSHYRPVILVGHCVGGLVIKQFLLMTDEKRHQRSWSDKNFLGKFLDTNLAGIFYYGTPHGGSTVLENLAINMKGKGSLLDFVRTIGKDAARLNSEFQNWRMSSQRSIPVFSMAESLPTSAWSADTVIVDQASVEQDTDDILTVSKDHITVCKPTGKEDSTYKYLKQFIEDKALSGNELNMT